MSKAAIDLGITKQALSLYLKQKTTPGADVLRRICKLWNLQLNIHGAIVSADMKSAEVRTEQPAQLPLFAALAGMQDQKLDVSVLKKGEQSIELKVSINFG